MDTTVKRGDIFYADLSPVVGSEQGGTRPVLIVQNDTGNRHSPTVIAAAITSQTGKARLPTHINIAGGSVGLSKDSVILLEQVRTIDKRRLREHMGHLDDDHMAMVDDAIAVSLGLRFGGAMLGYPVMDCVASLVIFVFIAKAAYDIFKDAMDKMVDHSCDEETENKMRECVLQNENVHGIDMLQTRIFGNKIYVDVEILLDATLSLGKAHAIAEEVHDDIERNFPKVKHIMIHVNPYEM